MSQPRQPAISPEDLARAVARAADRRLQLGVRLADGRWLAYAEFGAPDGRPVFVFHGVPGSRLLMADDRPIAAAGLRMIALDRPGIGRSDPQPGRRLLDWPRDVAALADTLGLRTFAVAGGSGGGPYALACAHALPARVTRVVLAASLAPFDRPGALDGFAPSRAFAWWMLRHAPLQRQITSWMQARLFRKEPAWMLGKMTRRMSAADRAAVADAAIHDVLLGQLREAYRQGWRGVAQDFAVLTRPWGFDLASVTTPVDVWQGLDDENVPEAMGRYLAAALPNCRARFEPGGGHFGPLETMDEILAVLAADDGGDASAGQRGGSTGGGGEGPAA